MDALDVSGRSEDFGTASVPMRFRPAIGASNTFAAVIPQSATPGFSPVPGIFAPNHGSSAPATHAAATTPAINTMRIPPPPFMIAGNANSISAPGLD